MLVQLGIGSARPNRSGAKLEYHSSTRPAEEVVEEVGQLYEERPRIDLRGLTDIAGLKCGTLQDCKTAHWC